MMTLGKLKRMSGDRLSSMWMSSDFPFDAADCSYCATMHDTWAKECRVSHKELSKALAGCGSSSGASLKKNLTKIWNARIKYRQFWRVTPGFPQAVKSTKKEKANASV